LGFGYIKPNPKGAFFILNMGCNYSYYTRKEIEEQTDCWVLINDKIYNITSYIDYHPGGADCILKNK